MKPKVVGDRNPRLPIYKPARSEHGGRDHGEGLPWGLEDGVTMEEAINQLDEEDPQEDQRESD